MIVGLSGYARSGKDEAAKALVNNHGFQRRAFADKLREVLLAINPIVDIQSVKVRAFAPDERVEVRVSNVIETYGWDGYKESVYGNEVRSLLQRLGTEAGRKLISDTIWIDATLGGPNDTEHDIVVTDVRFPNEASEIINRGGMLIRLHRPGVEPANAHPSETALDDFQWFDADIINDGSINQLHDRIRSAVLRFG